MGPTFIIIKVQNLDKDNMEIEEKILGGFTDIPWT